MIIYHGPSRLAPSRDIVAIVTCLDGESENPKTGPMAQLYIVDAGPLDPVQLRAMDDERSTCGGCPLQGEDGLCYVNLGQAPLTVWRRWRAGWYRPARPERIARAARLCAGLRLGAYGDPLALPQEVIADLVAAWRAAAPLVPITGYTHQWRRRDAQWGKRYTMASVETWDDAARAAQMGWRVFHAGPPSERPAGLVQCPNDTHGVTCADCGLCQGTSRPARSIYINLHGSMATADRVVELIA
jgi:hypothetical protein